LSEAGRHSTAVDRIKGLLAALDDDLLYEGQMQTPEHNLSPTELRMLRAIADGNQHEVAPDFVADPPPMKWSALMYGF
jgi:hypothetical protein